MGFWTNPEFKQLAPHVATLPEPKNSSVQPSGVVSVSQNWELADPMHISFGHGWLGTRPWSRDIFHHFQLRKLRFLGFRSQAGSVPGWRLGVFLGGPSTWTNFWRSRSLSHMFLGFSLVPNPRASPGKQLASACWDGVARIYDLENEVEPMELRGHTGGGVVILFPTRQSRCCFSLRGFFNSKSKVVICCYFPWWVLYQVHNGSHNECPLRRPLWGTLAAQDLCVRTNHQRVVKKKYIYSSGVNYIIIIS